MHFTEKENELQSGAVTSPRMPVLLLAKEALGLTRSLPYVIWSAPAWSWGSRPSSTERDPERQGENLVFPDWGGLSPQPQSKLASSFYQNLLPWGSALCSPPAAIQTPISGPAPPARKEGQTNG